MRVAIRGAAERPAGPDARESVMGADRVDVGAMAVDSEPAEPRRS